jgi:hypothetical protein
MCFVMSIGRIEYPDLRSSGIRGCRGRAMFEKLVGYQSSMIFRSDGNTVSVASLIFRLKIVSPKPKTIILLVPHLRSSDIVSLLGSIQDCSDNYAR